MKQKTLGQVACDEYQKFNLGLYYDSLTPRHKNAWSGVAHAVKMEVRGERSEIEKELVHVLSLAHD